MTERLTPEQIKFHRSGFVDLNDTRDCLEVLADALNAAYAEIDALRSELEAMRPVVEAACDLMAPFQWTTAGMNRLREAVGAYRDSRPERLCVAEGHMTVGPEGAFHDPDEGPCEWADSSRSVRNGE